jgi:hypothetical protein
VPELAISLQTMWRPGVHSFRCLGFADDAILTDASYGSLTLRSFAKQRDKHLQGLTNINCNVQDTLCDIKQSSSGRLWLHAQHGADGPLGSSTHKTIGYNIVLDLEAGPNINDIWQIRDQGALLRRLKIDLPTWARAHSAKPVTKPDAPCDRSLDPWADTLAELIKKIMSGDLSVIQSAYDPSVELWHPSGERRSGILAAETFWLSLCAAMPSAEFIVASATGSEDRPSPPRAAIRWYLHGQHDGWGRFGPPTQVAICAIGITQVEFGPRGIRREWTTIDELAVWRQIVAQTG